MIKDVTSIKHLINDDIYEELKNEIIYGVIDSDSFQHVENRVEEFLKLFDDIDQFEKAEIMQVIENEVYGNIYNLACDRVNCWEKAIDLDNLYKCRMKINECEINIKAFIDDGEYPLWIQIMLDDMVKLYKRQHGINWYQWYDFCMENPETVPYYWCVALYNLRNQLTEQGNTIKGLFYIIDW